MRPMLPICTKYPACLERDAPTLRNGKARSLRKVRKVGRYGTGIRAQKRLTRARLGSEEALAIWGNPARRLIDLNALSFPSRPSLPRYIFLPYLHLYLLIPCLVQSTAGILFCGTCARHSLFRSLKISPISPARSRSAQHTLTYSYLFPRVRSHSAWPTRTSGHCKFQESVVCASLLPCGASRYSCHR
jgi:hypothetical protein